MNRLVKAAAVTFLVVPGIGAISGCASNDGYIETFSREHSLSQNRQVMAYEVGHVRKSVLQTLVGDGFSITQANDELISATRALQDRKDEEISYLVTATASITRVGEGASVVTISANQRTTEFKKKLAVVKSESTIHDREFYDQFFRKLSETAARLPIDTPRATVPEPVPLPVSVVPGVEQRRSPETHRVQVAPAGTHHTGNATSASMIPPPTFDVQRGAGSGATGLVEIGGAIATGAVGAAGALAAPALGAATALQGAEAEALVKTTGLATEKVIDAVQPPLVAPGLGTTVPAADLATTGVAAGAALQTGMSSAPVVANTAEQTLGLGEGLSGTVPNEAESFVSDVPDDARQAIAVELPEESLTSKVVQGAAGAAATVGADEAKARLFPDVDGASAVDMPPASMPTTQ